MLNMKGVTIVSTRRLKIGEIAKRVRINPKTIRYYEEIGLLPKAMRNDSGYRVYSQEDLSGLQFIRRAKLLGLTLAETRGIFQYAVREQCGELQQHLAGLLERKLEEVDERIAELAALKNDLLSVRRDLLQRLEQGASLNPSLPLECQCLSDEVEDVSVTRQSTGANAPFAKAREGQTNAGKEVSSMAREKVDRKSGDNKEAKSCGCGCIAKNAKK